MKKLSKVLFSLLISSALIAGCSANKSTETKTSEATATTETASGECAVKIGLVTDTGGVDDKSFNQSAWEGVQKFAEENNLKDCVQYLQSNSETDYIPNLTTLAEEGYDLVIAVGYLFQDAIDTVSAQFPNSNFLFIDSVSPSTNVMNAVYSAEQGSYLVGIAAGRKAIENGSKTVGFVGGAEGALIGAFQAGYEQGVLSVCADCKIYVDYADSFSDDAKGQQLAYKQYGAGATVIYQAAGAAGNGVIKEAKERGDVWAIGVDKDQYEDGKVDGDKSIILTSMVKRVDISTYTASTNVLNKKFEPGTTVFDLTNEGVGAEISTGRNLTDEDITAIKEAAEAIKSGKIVVDANPTIKNGSTN